MQVPSLNGFELVLPCRPSRTFRLPDFVGHLPRVQKRLETGFVRMRDVVRILVEPVRPWFLDAVLTEVDLTDDQDIRGLGEVRLQSPNVSIDLLVVQDVTVDL